MIRSNLNFFHLIFKTKTFFLWLNYGIENISMTNSQCLIMEINQFLLSKHTFNTTKMSVIPNFYLSQRVYFDLECKRGLVWRACSLDLFGTMLDEKGFASFFLKFTYAILRHWADKNGFALNAPIWWILGHSIIRFSLNQFSKWYFHLSVKKTGKF